jgi:hypothetical protein
MATKKKGARELLEQEKKHSYPQYGSFMGIGYCWRCFEYVDEFIITTEW